MLTVRYRDASCSSQPQRCTDFDPLYSYPLTFIDLNLFPLVRLPRQ